MSDKPGVITIELKEIEDSYDAPDADWGYWELKVGGLTVESDPVRVRPAEGVGVQFMVLDDLLTRARAEVLERWEDRAP